MNSYALFRTYGISPAEAQQYLASTPCATTGCLVFVVPTNEVAKQFPVNAKLQTGVGSIDQIINRFATGHLGRVTA